MPMKQRNASYRERYFQDNQVVRIPANNRKGYKTSCRYVGLWKSWEGKTGDFLLKTGLLEVLSTGIYLLSTLSNAAINHARFASGLGILSVIPWLAEWYGVVSFLLARPYVRELSMEEINGCIRWGCAIRGLLVIASALAGLVECLAAGSIAWQDTPALAGLLASGGISLFLRHHYGKLPILTYRNEAGNPGSRI